MGVCCTSCEFSEPEKSNDIIFMCGWFVIFGLFHELSVPYTFVIFREIHRKYLRHVGPKVCPDVFLSFFFLFLTHL